MANDYYAEQARQELERRAKNYREKYEAWRKVARNYTKEGRPFKILSKNFDGAYIKDSGYDSKYIYVYYHGYETDEILITPSVGTYDKEMREKYAGRLQPRGYGLTPYVEYDADEVWDCIQNRIKRCEERAIEHEKMLERFDEVAMKIVEMRKAVTDYIKEQPQDFYYLLEGIMKERRP